MADCELTDICVFFNEYSPVMKAVAEGLKRMYCYGDNSECARLLVYNEIGAALLPDALFPNDVNTANKIIAKYSS